MRLSQRLTALFLLPMLALAVVGALAWRQISQLHDSNSFMAGNVAASFAHLSHVADNESRLITLLGSVGRSTTDAERAAWTKEFDTTAADAAALLEDYRLNLVADDEDGRLVVKAQSALTAWIATMRDVQQRSHGENTPEQAAAMARLEVNERGFREALDALQDHNEGLMFATREATATSMARSRTQLIWGLAGCFLFSLLVGGFNAGLIVRRMRALTSTVDLVAHGDYAREVPFQDAPDETGELARSVHILKERASAVAAQRRIKSDLAALVAQLQQTTTMEAFGAVLIDGLLAGLSGDRGRFYLHTGTALHLVAADAGDEPADTTTAPGSRAVRAAAERTLIAEEQALALPLVAGGQLLACVDVECLTPLTPESLTFAGEVMQMAAVMLESLQRQLHTAQTEAWYRQIIGAAPGGLIAADANGHAVFANQQAEEILGVAPGSLTRQAPAALLAEVQAFLQSDTDSAETARRLLTLTRPKQPDRFIEAEFTRMTPSAERPAAVCIAVRDVTERERTQASMRKLTRAMEQLSSSLIITDAAGRIEFTNPYFTKLSGYTQEEVLGRNPRLLQSGQVPRETYAELWRTLTAGEVWRGELINKRKDGTIYILAATLSPVLDADNRITHYIGIGDDITERRRLDDALKFTQFVVENASPMVWITTDGGHVRFTNRAASEQLGYTREEFLRMSLSDFDVQFPPDQLQPLYQQLKASGQTVILPTRIRRRDGHVLDMEVTLFLAEDRARSYFVGLLADVTERKRIDAELLRQKQRVEQLLREAPVGVGIAVDGRLAYVNDSWQQLIGLPVGEDMAVAWVDPARRMEILDRLTREDVVRNADVQMRGTDGVIRDVLITFMKTSYEGQPAVLKWMTDITHLKAAQAATERALGAADAATRAKSEFLANMSHEIRTPMNAIIGMTHLALRTELTPKQRGYVEKIDRAAENLLGIINDILDFSKLEAGKMAIESIDFRLDEVFDALASMIGFRAEAKGLELAFDVTADVPETLIGDPMRLGQILTNLGSNAVKFTPAGTIVVGVRRTRDGSTLHFWVRDTGVGLSEEQQQRLFQSFSQADSSTTRRFGGTGLGLAISRSLVEKMGGRIWVESLEGEGSTFHFTLPLTLPAVADRQSQIDTSDIRGMRVLIVDDNSHVRAALETMATSVGMRVAVAATEADALEQIRHAGEPFGLALIDWHLPGTDGIGAAKAIHASASATLPVVLMTPAHGREDALLGGDEHVRAVLHKPVLPSALLNAVGDALGKRLVAAEPTAERGDQADDARQQLIGARLLLVEDNYMNQALAVELLQDAGITVLVASNGREAIEMLDRDADVDGVLMDIQMPEMDGYEATREIRRRPALATLPVLAMTASALTTDRDKAFAAGMNDHISKPLDIHKMFRTIARWIHPAEHRRRAPDTPGVSQPDTARASALPIDVPGLDVADGVTRLGGKTDLYRRQLVSFLEGNRDFGARFAAARAGADPRGAERVAHTLKSQAATIGARDLANAAATLETALAHGADDASIQSALTRALSALTPIVAGLGTHLANAAAPRASAVADPRQLTAQLDELAGLLDRSNAGAVQAARRIESQLSGSPAAAVFAPVVRLIADYDFDRATDALRAFRVETSL